MSIMRAKDELSKLLKLAKKELKDLFFEQIDGYVDELINKSIC
jgi:hypothetical protein